MTHSSTNHLFHRIATYFCLSRCYQGQT